MKKKLQYTLPNVKKAIKKEKKNLILWLIWIQLVIITIVLGVIASNLHKSKEATVATLTLQKNFNDRMYVNYNSNYEMTDNSEQILTSNLPEITEEKKESFFIQRNLLKLVNFTASKFKIYRTTEITHNGQTTVIDNNKNSVLAKLLKSARTALEPTTVNCFAITSKKADNIAGETHRAQLMWMAWKKRQQEEKERQLELSLNANGFLGSLNTFNKL